MITGTVKKATPGMSGFDVNRILTSAEAATFKAAGMSFCMRYLPRTQALAPGNLTAEEAEDILEAGLCLGAVQHVPLPNWMPTPELGTEYGVFASQYAKSTVGLPPGITLWLDLEMVSAAATWEDIVGYCTNWFRCVTAAGYLGGLYVGYQTGLSENMLYGDLPFTSYWRAYNGGGVATRGYQMLQHTQQSLNGVQYDPNTTQLDQLGDTFTWLSHV